MSDTACASSRNVSAAVDVAPIDRAPPDNPPAALMIDAIVIGLVRPPNDCHLVRISRCLNRSVSSLDHSTQIAYHASEDSYWWAIAIPTLAQPS